MDKEMMDNTELNLEELGQVAGGLSEAAKKDLDSAIYLSRLTTMTKEDFIRIYSKEFDRSYNHEEWMKYVDSHWYTEDHGSGTTSGW